MSKDKITEICEEILSSDDASESKTQNDKKLAMMGDGTTINIMESSPVKEENRYDDSAEKQGRKKVNLRQHGDIIDPQHMTPKEFRNFTGGIWDGVEKRDGIYNWTAHTWERKANKLVSRRHAERRTKQIRYEGKNQRTQKRREQDKSKSFHENILYYSGLALGYGIILSLFILIALGGVS